VTVLLPSMVTVSIEGSAETVRTSTPAQAQALAYLVKEAPQGSETYPETSFSSRRLVSRALSGSGIWSWWT